MISWRGATLGLWAPRRRYTFLFPALAERPVFCVGVEGFENETATPGSHRHRPASPPSALPWCFCFDENITCQRVRLTDTITYKYINRIRGLGAVRYSLRRFFRAAGV